MNILFLCASLEPGKDGVGDYVRLLASACRDHGHRCRLLAINDEFVGFARQEMQATPTGDIEAWRLSASQSWSERFEASQQCIADFPPDWLSWQLVPYGFQRKGILPKELHTFALLGKGRLVHIMLHELWIGIAAGEPLKNRLYGRLQQRALTGFLRRLQPQLLHTSNVVYREVLDRAGFVANLLPLFGNIPVAEMNRDLPSNREWLGGIFGTVHPQLKPEPLFSTLAKGAQVSGRQLRIIGLGRLGAYGEEMFARLAVDYGQKIIVSHLGEKSPPEISRILQTLNFGIATHPWALQGKSGAIAAMLDHGLPVIVPRDDWSLRKPGGIVPAIDPLVVPLSHIPPELMAGRLSARRAPAPRLPAIAAHFVESLAAAQSGAYSEP